MKRQLTEKLWREEKYRIMFHSQKHYDQIRLAMREQLDHEYIELLIHEGLRQAPTIESMRNACQHMWGYFRKTATPEEKHSYELLLNESNIPTLLSFFKVLAIRYNVAYLRESSILFKND